MPPSFRNLAPRYYFPASLRLQYIIVLIITSDIIFNILLLYYLFRIRTKITVFSCSSLLTIWYFQCISPYKFYRNFHLNHLKLQLFLYRIIGKEDKGFNNVNEEIKTGTKSYVRQRYRSIHIQTWVSLLPPAHYQSIQVIRTMIPLKVTASGNRITSLFKLSSLAQ